MILAIDGFYIVQVKKVNSWCLNLGIEIIEVIIGRIKFWVSFFTLRY